MNILMMTNTFTPHRGGVARSVSAFTKEYRRRGHRVLVVAPEFEDAPEHETDVVRVPAIQNFNGSDFSVVLPIPGLLHAAIDDFHPDIVHTHHPFLLGETAFRVAASRMLPLVFTHHTMYEHYTHYVPGDSPLLKRFVIELTTQYANLCDRVFAPSESTAAVLRQRGIETPITVVPTGVSLAAWSHADGAACRKANGIPAHAFVVGHVGRLAEEKNLRFLATAVAAFLNACQRGHFLLAGSGDQEQEIVRILTRAGVADRLHRLGGLDQAALADVYGAMDVFAFASHSETQGMVLAEAMATGVPVVALDAPGVREVVEDGANGRLLQVEDSAAFAAAVAAIEGAAPAERQRLVDGAKATAAQLSIGNTAATALAVYARLSGRKPDPGAGPYDHWLSIVRLIETEWKLVAGFAEAAGSALAHRVPEGGAD